MIEHLKSPSVCVVDDEQEDYRPILNALNSLQVGCVHLTGAVADLPASPFSRLRLIFLDLHLNNTTGKDAASYTANAFTRIVSPRTAPIVVVIWSKYSGDIVDRDIPEDDQETEADLFKRTLFEAEAGYQDRLVFVEMAKPKPADRPDEWTKELAKQIAETLKEQSAIDALWTWEASVQEGCNEVCSELTAVAKAAIEEGNLGLAAGLKGALQALAEAQGEGDLTKQNAPSHLTAALSQLLADQLEHPESTDGLAAHGEWLCQAPDPEPRPEFSAHMNGILVVADLAVTEMRYTPGTVYRVTNHEQFEAHFGCTVASLFAACSEYKETQEDRWREWTEAVKPVLIELSPVCDVAQGKRVSSLLLAGLLVPTESNIIRKGMKKADVIIRTPVFRMRWPVDGSDVLDALLLFNHRFRTTLPEDSNPGWFEPWFRLRELPTSAIRNANAASAARVGYVSL